MKYPAVSIIITTKNEEDVIASLLKSVKRQTYPNIEIIVVDNHSTDKTCDIVKRFGIAVLTDGPERSAQRNAGAKCARGRYVFFLDADMVLSESVVFECVDMAVKNSDAKLIVVPERSAGVGFWAACKTLERRCYEGDATLEAARFFDKKAFWDAGGYDERLTGPEDWDLPQRMQQKYPLRRIFSYIMHNERRVRLRSLMKKKFYYGLKVSKYISQHPLSVTGTQLVYLFRPAFYRNWRLLARDPVHAIGMIIMLGFEQVAGFAGFVRGRMV
ncbi:glycosyltransferase [Candidatus Gottesmanbacteria bacterium]|nr:glycosyltransferase [Candidatus Gottesmanbacteria bacterium]